MLVFLIVNKCKNIIDFPSCKNETEKGHRYPQNKQYDFNENQKITSKMENKSMRKSECYETVSFRP